MKIKEGYILDEIGDQKVAISLKCGENDFSEMIKLNEIGAFLWEKLSEEIEEEKLVEAVTEAYDIDSATAVNKNHMRCIHIIIFLQLFICNNARKILRECLIQIIINRGMIISINRRE